MKTSPRGGKLLERIAALAALALAPLVLIIAGFAAYVYAGVVAGGKEEAGTIAGLGVRAPVRVVRDARGIPHVRAQNEHDLYFAEGYLQGSDRLFQLDVYRRLVSGRLSEIFGSATLANDEAARIVDVNAIARAQLAALTAQQRDDLDAFSGGVNAAIASRPLPPEFRVLMYRPEPWQPIDSLIVSFSTVLALTDSWDDVAMRSDVNDAFGRGSEAVFFPASDPYYDSPTTGSGHAPVAKLPDLTNGAFDAPQLYVAQNDAHEGLGSNDFAAGASKTRTGHSLLANDPHLELRMPGVWWLADLEAPGLHVAGATLAGVPGIVLGHNAHLAWGATNGTVATVRVFRERFRGGPNSDSYLAGGNVLHAEHRRETIGVRFGKSVVRDYLRTRHGFIFEDRGSVKLAAAWTADEDRRSGLGAFDGLARAVSVAQAQRVLASYPGPPQNFALADDAGNAGFSLAGEIPIDDAWGMHVHDGVHAAVGRVPYVPPAVLPHVSASRDAIVFTANARTYGAGYPYRLTSGFAPPYRAARIAQLLAHGNLDVAAFSGIQADVLSLPERDLARATSAAVRDVRSDGADFTAARAALAAWDGRFTSDSLGATYAVALRRSVIERLVRYHLPRELAIRYLGGESGSAFEQVLRMLCDRPRGWVPHDDYPAFLVASFREAIDGLRARHNLGKRWAEIGARTAEHPLASFGLTMWNGVRFPGLGDGYSPHVQAPANAQSFRAVWDVGAWERGGMVVPQGESGEPGSAHYRDGAPVWLAGTLVPLPFDDAAVDASAKSSLFMRP